MNRFPRPKTIPEKALLLSGTDWSDASLGCDYNTHAWENTGIFTCSSEIHHIPQFHILRFVKDAGYFHTRIEILSGSNGMPLIIKYFNRLPASLHWSHSFDRFFIDIQTERLSENSVNSTFIGLSLLDEYPP